MSQSISRRNFVRQFSAGAAGLSLCRLPVTPVANPRKLEEIGVILGFMGDLIRTDPVGLLEKIAAIGYKTVEFGGSFGKSPAELRQLLDGLGLKALGGGGAMAQLLENLPRQIDEANELGKPFVVCYWPWLHSAEQITTDDALETAERLNKIGEQCKKEGVQFVFHNHDKEFNPTDTGAIPCDILLDETDPDLVNMELDLYWVIKGGADPIDYIERYPGRFPIFHVKDMDSTPEKGFETPGKGIIDFPAIFAKSERAGTSHFIVERDNAPDPMQTVIDAYAYLSRVEF